MCVFCNTSVYLVGSRSAGFSLCTTRWNRSLNGWNIAFKLLRSLVYARNLLSGLVRLVQGFEIGLFCHSAFAIVWPNFSGICLRDSAVEITALVGCCGSKR